MEYFCTKKGGGQREGGRLGAALRAANLGSARTHSELEPGVNPECYCVWSKTEMTPLGLERQDSG